MAFYGKGTVTIGDLPPLPNGLMWAKSFPIDFIDFDHKQLVELIQKSFCEVLVFIECLEADEDIPLEVNNLSDRLAKILFFKSVTNRQDIYQEIGQIVNSYLQELIDERTLEEPRFNEDQERLGAFFVFHFLEDLKPILDERRAKILQQIHSSDEDSEEDANVDEGQEQVETGVVE